jgi:hypothetical protein
MRVMGEASFEFPDLYNFDSERSVWQSHALSSHFKLVAIRTSSCARSFPRRCHPVASGQLASIFFSPGLGRVTLTVRAIRLGSSEGSTASGPHLTRTLRSQLEPESEWHEFVW